MKNALGLALVSLAVFAPLVCAPPAARAQTYVFTQNFGAGKGSGNGNLNGVAGVAVDNSGNVYVADGGNRRVVEFSSAGSFIRNYAVIGVGLALDSKGNLYTGTQQFNLATGIVTKSFGNGGSGDGGLANIAGIAIDGSDNLYVADYGFPQFSNCRIVEFNTVTGNFIQNFSSSPNYIGGTGTGQLSSPRDVAVDKNGNVYAADYDNDRIVKFDGAGAVLQNFYGSGSGNGQFGNPYAIAVDKDGNVCVYDPGTRVYNGAPSYPGKRIVEFNSAGAFVQTIGSSGAGNGQFGVVSSMRFDSSGSLYVCDQNNSRVVKFARTSDSTNGSFTGRITLEGTNDPEQKIVFTFRPKPSGVPIVIKQVLTATAISDTGSFSIPNIPFGTYDVAIKGVCWLQKVMPGVVFSAGSPPANITALLTGADLNNDNQVDPTDFGILVGDYNTAGDP